MFVPILRAQQTLAVSLAPLSRSARGQQAHRAGCDKE